MELSLKFRLRSSQNTGAKPRQLQIRLTVDGVTTSDYGSGVTVRPTKWNQHDQMVTGRDKAASETNERLAEIELEHREILRELKRRYQRGQGPRPTADLVKAEFQDPGSTQPRLLPFYNTYLEHAEALAGIDETGERTFDRMYKTRGHLVEYVASRDKMHPQGPYLPDITVAFGREFHAWLLLDPKTKKHRMNATSAARYVSDLRKCLGFGIESGHLQHNVLEQYTPKQTDRKPVYFLEMVHLIQLMQLDYTDTQMSATLWWARLMCLTGLDYRDAIRYARNRDAYEQDVDQHTYRLNVGQDITNASLPVLTTTAPTADKLQVYRKIVIRRTKPPKNECEIPLLPQVELLFQQHPTGPYAPGLTDLNDWLRVIEAALGFPRRFSSKICRKTAGFYFLMLRYRIEAVSKILGHSSIRTTEDHYVKVTSSFIDAEIKRVNDEVRQLH